MKNLVATDFAILPFAFSLLQLRAVLCVVTELFHTGCIGDYQT